MASTIAELAALLYTVNEVADLCEITRATVYKHMKQGILPFEYVAGRRLMHEDDIHVYRAIIEQRGKDSEKPLTDLKKGGKRAK